MSKTTLPKFQVPPLFVFEDYHAQVFMPKMKRAGMFTRTQIRTVGDEGRQLSYSIDFDYIPAKGKKRAIMTIKFKALVRDL